MESKKEIIVLMIVFTIMLIAIIIAYSIVSKKIEDYDKIKFYQDI